MAATWVSKIGCGMRFAMCQTISMSWRAAWKTLSTCSLAIRSKNGCQVEARRQGVDDDGFIGAGDLRDAEQRIVGRLAQELGVDRDERMRGKPRAGRQQVRAWS